MLTSLPPLASASSSLSSESTSRQNKTPKSNHNGTSSNCQSIRQHLTSPAKNYSNNRVVLIPNDRFYRSPSKSLTTTVKEPEQKTPVVSSFADRFKKATSTQHEAEQQQHHASNNQQITPPSSGCVASSSTVHLFSPMKRLRLDEMLTSGVDRATNENLSPHLNFTRQLAAESSLFDSKRFQLPAPSTSSQPFSQQNVQHQQSHYEDSRSLVDHSYTINAENQSAFNSWSLSFLFFSFNFSFFHSNIRGIYDNDIIFLLVTRFVSIELRKIMCIFSYLVYLLKILSKIYIERKNFTCYSFVSKSIKFHKNKMS